MTGRTITVHEQAEFLTEIVVAGEGEYSVYDAVLDDKTGDWLVSSDDDDQIQGEWMASQDDAIRFLMQHTGVVEDAEYERARERC